MRAHLVGIGGSGMRALTDVLLGWNWRISGSDRNLDSAEELAAVGVHLSSGHAAENLPRQTDLVIYTDAVEADNPELRRAAKLGIPAISYFEMAGRLTHRKEALAVAGTHGKSTTTAMAAHIFIRAGRDPTVLCGASPLGRSSGGRAGSGDLVLVEACEYRANFLKLHPRQVVLLGIEPDHFDYYRTDGQLVNAFRQFAQSVPPDGRVLVRADCPVSRRVANDLPCRVETFGIGGGDWAVRAMKSQQGRYAFEIRHRRFRPCEIKLRVPGRHNMLNALAAAALACENGVAPEIVKYALSEFRGLHRRLEYRGMSHGTVLLDDYAHHPTEVSAALCTVRRMYPGRRLWCVFQPHQVSRTERLLDELAESLQNAEEVFVAEIFRARDGAPKEGEVTAADLAAAVRRRGASVSGIHVMQEIINVLKDRLMPDDVLLTMGAGNVGAICGRLVRSIHGGLKAA